MQRTEGASTAKGCPQGLVQGGESVADEDLDSSDESLWERVLKIIVDMDVQSSGLQREGMQGKDMGAPLLAFGEEVAQSAGSSQLASAPSSADAMLGVGIQVRRTQYFFLLEIDGLFMWQWFGQSGPLKDNCGLLYREKCITSLGLALRSFLSSVWLISRTSSGLLRNLERWRPSMRGS